MHLQGDFLKEVRRARMIWKPFPGDESSSQTELEKGGLVGLSVTLNRDWCDYAIGSSRSFIILSLGSDFS